MAHDKIKLSREKCSHYRLSIADVSHLAIPHKGMFCFPSKSKTFYYFYFILTWYQIHFFVFFTRFQAFHHQPSLDLGVNHI